jgi:hypothetical protein
MIVAGRKVEPHWAPATAAFVTVSAAKKPDSSGLFLPSILPRVHIFEEKQLAHATLIAAASD